MIISQKEGYLLGEGYIVHGIPLETIFRIYYVARKQGAVHSATEKTRLGR